MAESSKPKIYRDFVDDLVKMCRSGLGQVGAERARSGIWNKNATADFLEDQHEVNLLLARMTNEDRETLAKMLTDAVVNGVFETLKALEQYQIPPFEDGYEGSPYDDFIGRLLNVWEWPES